ncbi:LysR family transcriptional regulator [Roseomonas sp. PWR1]|uniref:LysR family transcriptional regulator n=1 Tax=Roseomonas nitratireducens TaxID=2820810 RepID=A0ABS4AVN4_9PROT|nr:LysR family transcriptional regulator [Neoroseomonas nitratireducens]
MDSRQLRYFTAVGRERNFTRAAEKLRIAQPTLSRAIQQFEDTFGVALLDRASRPLALTDAGRLLFEQAVQVLDRMDEMKARRVRNMRISSRGFHAKDASATRSSFCLA